MLVMGLAIATFALSTPNYGQTHLFSARAQFENETFRLGDLAICLQFPGVSMSLTLPDRFKKHVYYLISQYFLE